MGLKKGQTGNPKGRPKGRPNKVTSEVREWIRELIDGNRGQLEKDLKALEPKDRWVIIERLMAYTTPKIASVTIAEQLEAEYAALEKLLQEAPDEALNAIEAKLKHIQELNKQGNERK